MRIASLLPSTTEMVCALGFEDHLVARSHECDYPASVKHLPALTAPKFVPDGRSYEINQRVLAVLQEATSVYRIDGELLKALSPDVILTQVQCEVCAVSFSEVERAACEWLDYSAEIVALEPNRLEDVLDDIERVARSLGVPERGRSLRDSIVHRMQTLASRASTLVPIRVATIEWLDPIMAAGNWMPELVEMAGGLNLFGESGKHSPWIQWDELVQADPDVLILLPCGYDIATTLREASVLIEHPLWRQIKAVKTQRVYVADGNQYFNRPGPRLAESLEILAEILHPDMFHFGFEGAGWQRLCVD